MKTLYYRQIQVFHIMACQDLGLRGAGLEAGVSLTMVNDCVKRVKKTFRCRTIYPAIRKLEKYHVFDWFEAGGKEMIIQDDDYPEGIEIFRISGDERFKELRAAQAASETH